MCIVYIACSFTLIVIKRFTVFAAIIKTQNITFKLDFTKLIQMEHQATLLFNYYTNILLL